MDGERPRREIAISVPDLGEEEWRALREPLERGWLTQGPRVAAFERAFAERHGVRHAAACTSCTTGLHLALSALEIGPGDEVIVPAFTWVSTANAVLYCGAVPVLADVDPDTFNVVPAEVARRLTPRTRAVIPVHLFGRCADVDAIRAVLPSGVAVVEDAACAAGAAYKGRPAGSLGDLAVFSFHPRKVITTGEGGMVTTDHDTLAARVRALRDHGASLSEETRLRGGQPYLLPEFNRLGYNYRMTDLQGAVGVIQMSKLDRLIRERAAGADLYRKELAGVEWLRLPDEPADGRHGWQAFVTSVDPDKAPRPRNELMAILHRQGIATRPGTHAVHLLGYYQKRFGFRPEDFPHARDADRNSLAIPLHNRMTYDDFHDVVAALRSL
jgi:dTDP-4-amino-4,6-dideoxygalactose transaminase